MNGWQIQNVIVMSFSLHLGISIIYGLFFFVKREMINRLMAPLRFNEIIQEFRNERMNE